MNSSVDDSTNYTDPEEYVDEILRHRELESLVLRISADILTIIALLAIISNIFVCSVILKYRGLRQKAAYKIIAGWLIVNSIFMSSFPIVMQTGFGARYLLSPLAMCRFGQLNFVAFLGTVLFIVLLTFQWFFKFYNPSVTTKYDKAIIYYICFLSGFLVLVIIEGMIVCEHSFILAFMNDYIVILLFFAFVIFMIVMNIIHSCKKKILDNGYGKDVAYILSNVFFVSHFLSLILLIFVYFGCGGEIYLLITMCISFMLTLICPLYFFYFLYKYDNKFCTLTNHVVSCRCTKYTGDELFDQPMHYEKQGVQQNEEV